MRLSAPASTTPSFKASSVSVSRAFSIALQGLAEMLLQHAWQKGDENDHAFLLRGDVFTKDVIETWLAHKREKEVDAIRLRPHPYEFHLYYDI